MRSVKSLYVLGAAYVIGALGLNSTPIYALSTDSHFAFVLEEYLALSNAGGASTGEVLRAASQIVPGDFESWYSEFKFLADALHTKATSIDSKRFPVSAREAYFRASSYYRAADFYLHGNQSDPRINSLWNSALADFDAATSLLPIPPIRKNLTANGFTVPIIYFPAQPQYSANGHHGRQPSVKTPTVIVGTGYDGNQEALYHTIGRSILERGWNYVSYEGPGQPTVRRQQNAGFIDNWWDVVSPIVDYLETRDDVDTKKVALAGLSFGGILAPRAASREHRISAVLAIDGLMNLQKTINLGDQLTAIFKSGNKTVFDKVMTSVMNNSSMPTNLRWGIAQGTWAFNTTSPFEWFTGLGKVTAEADTLANVTSPVLVAEGEHDTIAPGQAVGMYETLGDLATYNLFRTELGAGEHCQLGAEAQLAQVSLDWLLDVWDKVQIPKNTTGGTY
uniref:Dienelactone hydrolase domain-containing protein n=1 Tax=Bionectria ochroleuca TaxID=29856 RepID=A0A8H7NQI9_BIOOC